MTAMPQDARATRRHLFAGLAVVAAWAASGVLARRTAAGDLAASRSAVRDVRRGTRPAAGQRPGRRLGRRVEEQGKTVWFEVGRAADVAAEALLEAYSQGATW